jgi:hypothetical protein
MAGLFRDDDLADSLVEAAPVAFVLTDFEGRVLVLEISG